MMSKGGEQRGGERRARGRVTQVSAELDRERGVFMISVAAELADMHPQTLRMYESRGLIRPKRSPKNTRLYSQEDVEKLRRIQEMTAEQGLNLAGVETVLALEEKLGRMRSELQELRSRAKQMEQRMVDEVERARRSLGAELVPRGLYSPHDSAGAGRGKGRDGVRIPVERGRRRREPGD
jgi:MerR family transcriptional regulator/heat shock protein HspR